MTPGFGPLPRLAPNESAEDACVVLGGDVSMPVGMGLGVMEVEEGRELGERVLDVELALVEVVFVATTK